ncbi:MAG: NADAR family protein [Bacteroidales bacterium]|nr:NADAR family protein [Bacteroidales bacterium]
MHVSQFIEKYYPEYYSWNEYPADRTVGFCKVADEWGIFSNFAQTPITIGGVTFYSAESLFQVMKFSDTSARKAIYSYKGQGLKMQAKHLEKTVGVREDWGRIIVDALKFCLAAKYEQSEEFRKELERSRGKFIVEDQTTFTKPADTYGAKLSKDGISYSGPNLMGRLLMELRDKGKLEYVLPEGTFDFSDLG